MHKILMLFFCTLGLVACQPTAKTDIQKLEQLVGVWQSQSNQSIIYETWGKVSDKELRGKSYSLQGNDTIVYESIVLIAEGKSWALIPTVANQNNNKPIKFLALKLEDKVWTFENPQHDFPQTITYSLIDANNLVATISGSINGNMQNQQIKMKRVVEE